MEMHVDALDFSTLKDALNIQAMSTEIVTETINMMTKDLGQLAVSVDLNLSTQDSSVSGTGSVYDFYI
ncbi:MAG: hypothetical protein V2A56_00535 [bacterium]